MGKIKDEVQDFLSNGGYDLGYDMKDLPKLKDLKTLIKNRVPLHEYYGFKTQEEFWEARYSQSHDQSDDVDEDFEPVEY